jgi:predicted DNA-binding protein (MmcQ/YjbR family)
MALPGATRITLWDRVDVYKVGGKAFATYGLGGHGLSVKVTPIGFEVLVRDGPGRQAPGFAHGHWANFDPEALQPDEVAEWIAGSYRLAAGNLTRKRRVELGLA